MTTLKLSPVLMLTSLLLVFAPLPALAAVEGSFQRDLKITGAVDLEVTTGSGSITVRPGASDVVRVTGRIRANDWLDRNAQERVRRLEANPPIEQNGNSIHIGKITDPELRRNLSISYEIVVPLETQLKSHTGSGNQAVDGIRGPVDANAGSGGIKTSNIGNTVHLETGSGDVEAEHVKGNLRARTGSGSIRGIDIAGGFEGNTGSGNVTLEQTATGAVRVESGSGEMELRGVRASLEARTGSGDIAVEGDPTAAWLLHTGSGSVQLKLPSEASFDLNAHTSSGRIHSDRPVSVQGSMGRHEIRGKVGGGGVPVEVETGSGNIEIR
jgi:hypothetical protein